MLVVVVGRWFGNKRHMSRPYRITVTRPSIYFRLDRHLLCCRWRRRRWGERVLLSSICNHQRSDREIALNLGETKRWMWRSNRLINPKVLCHCGNFKRRLPYILLYLREAVPVVVLCLSVLIDLCLSIVFVMAMNFARLLMPFSAPMRLSSWAFFPVPRRVGGWQTSGSH